MIGKTLGHYQITNRHWVALMVAYWLPLLAVLAVGPVGHLTPITKVLQFSPTNTGIFALVEDGVILGLSSFPANNARAGIPCLDSRDSSLLLNPFESRTDVLELSLYTTHACYG
jgi:hypothetical protein